MAIIAVQNQQAKVQAKGEVLNATVNFSGALMEMLATVYSNIVLAAIREAIQNGCDAARRKGLSFASGVTVLLPTKENPMLTVIDLGSGMNREFMETTYLSFGSSTKAGDNGAAGGLGVGRWAAYGYVREAYVTTTEESEMIERTYFQFQGPNGTPQVQLASESAGATAGTRVYFPVKENDIEEVYRAVAWLKAVMALTMGDSFTVDKPGMLPVGLPEFSGIRLELGDEDETLQGIVVYPMMDAALQYSRDGLVSGSLIVLTNQKAGVGGLPFHARITSTDSVFNSGMIIEIPMSYNVPFMPSREEVKYSDEVRALMGRIDKVATQMAIVKARELFNAHCLHSKTQLSNLLGTSENWHSLCFAARTGGKWSEPMRKATGGENWRGILKLPATPLIAAHGGTMSIQHLTDSRRLTRAFSSSGYLVISSGKSGGTLPLILRTDNPVTLIVNDVATGGMARFRQWIYTVSKNAQVLYFNAEKPGQARAAAEELSNRFGGGLVILSTSSFPAAPRTIVSGKVLTRTARGGTLTYYDCKSKKQETGVLSFDTTTAGEPLKVWLGKTGGSLTGFKATSSLRDIADSYGKGNLANFMTSQGLNKLYLLTEKQASTLALATAEATDAGLWDLEADEFGDDEESLANKETVNALKSWISYEEFLARMIATPEIQEVLEGNRVRDVTRCYEFERFCKALGDAPRFGLAGTKFDKSMRQHLDVVAGTVTILPDLRYSEDKWLARCDGLILQGEHLEENEADPAERKELIGALKRLPTVGKLNYTEVWESLKKEYPLVGVGEYLAVKSDAATVDHFCVALAALYR